MNKYYDKIRAKRNRAITSGWVSEDELKSLDKPVSLQNVLNLLDITNGCYTIDNAGNLGKEGGSGYKQILLIDLTKQFKDQAPEVHEAVWELIKEK